MGRFDVPAVLVLVGLCSACGITKTGSSEPYQKLRQTIENNPNLLTNGLARAEAESCLASAYDQSERAQVNRQYDMGMIASASAFGAAGVGLTAASTFVTTTQGNKRQWLAGAGMISVGLSAAILGLRTALNLGELSSSQSSAAATQAALSAQISHTVDNQKRDSMYADCIHLSSKPNASYPGSHADPTPPQPQPQPPQSSTPAAPSAPSSTH